jgi:branched-chain amino acid transport system ATP-binding protein
VDVVAGPCDVVGVPEGGLVLEVRDLRAGYGRTEVLAGVSFAVGAGQVLALLGAPGAGKSTALRAVAGVVAPTGGEVRLDGKPLAGLGAAAVARLGIALAPDGREPLAPGSTGDHLLLGAAPWAPRWLGYRKAIAPDLARVEALFPRLAARRDQPAEGLSGGERRMLAIGRALMARPRLLLLDEPFMGLSAAAAAEVSGVLARLRDEGLALLLACQDARPALALAGHACVLAQGRVALEGAPADLLRDVAALSAYLG